MADTPEHLPEETTEKGFGTGLRAQLQRRQTEGDSPTPEAQGQPNVELRFELTARPSGEGEPLAVSADVSALKSELDAARRREEALRLRLEKQTEAYSDGMSSEQELAVRASTLDEREARLAEFEVELEERERKVRTERDAIEVEHTRVADLQAELSAEQQLAAERQEQAESRLRELKGADRDRDKAKSELSKQFSALADREKKLERKEKELDTRDRAAERVDESKRQRAQAHGWRQSRDAGIDELQAAQFDVARAPVRPARRRVDRRA